MCWITSHFVEMRSCSAVDMALARAACSYVVSVFPGVGHASSFRPPSLVRQAAADGGFGRVLAGSPLGLHAVRDG